ncbi:hypothetical protein GQ600_13659 [Phytophthora cactorum]|nr:hypothetical protein GQ600_13659 [Phytophthora cactorum]
MYSHQPRYSGKCPVSATRTPSTVARRPHPYVPEAERSEDVVLAHRVSLDDDQRTPSDGIEDFMRSGRVVNEYTHLVSSSSDGNGQ